MDMLPDDTQRLDFLLLQIVDQPILLELFLCLFSLPHEALAGSPVTVAGLRRAIDRRLTRPKTIPIRRP
jgi:hypothetical protein